MKNPKTADFKKLLYDWGGYDFGKRKITVFDTTLRDGLQGPQVKRHPSLFEKTSFLEACCQLGIEAIELGFPASSEEHKKDVIALAKHAKKNNLKIILSCLSRTIVEDVETIVDVSQKAGVEVTVNLLIGSSKIRRLVEEWDLAEMEKWIAKSIKTAHKNNLPAEFVTEDGTRSDPKTLKGLYGAAIDNQVKRIWIADTVVKPLPVRPKKSLNFFFGKSLAAKKFLSTGTAMTIRVWESLTLWPPLKPAPTESRLLLWEWVKEPATPPWNRLSST